jgi:hypothetical protein
MPLLHDKPKYNWTRVPWNVTLNRTVQFNTTDDDATTPSSMTTSMHDTSTAGTPTPTDPDLDERVCNVLSHIFGDAHDRNYTAIRTHVQRSVRLSALLIT